LAHGENGKNDRKSGNDRNASKTGPRTTGPVNMAHGGGRTENASTGNDRLLQDSGQKGRTSVENDQHRQGTEKKVREEKRNGQGNRKKGAVKSLIHRLDAWLRRLERGLFRKKGSRGKPLEISSDGKEAPQE